MRCRSLRRSAVLALAVLLTTASGAFADTIAGDADTVTVGPQASRDLGTVGPGASVTVSAGFELRCKGLAHLDHGQSVALALDFATVPGDGAVSTTDGAIGPMPDTWPADAAGCSSPAETLSASTLATVTLIAPTTAGGPYTYTLFFARTVSPAGSGDGSALSSSTAVSFTLTVTGNTPPVLLLPADMVVEGDRTGGAAPSWSASATDAEDDPDPVPTCAPASGDFMPLGTTTVACTATDSGGMASPGSFGVTVVDTTPPVLSGLPSSLSFGTTDPAGRTVDYPWPTATDIVDASPAIACDPAPGAVFPVGTTSVTCTATDDSGNAASAGFPVTVHFYAAQFEPPVGPSNSLPVNGNRVVPVKVVLWTDGVPTTTGRAWLDVTACGGGPVLKTLPLAPPGADGRWFGLLSTVDLPAGCLRTVVRLDAEAAGSFTMNVAEASRRRF